MQNADDSDSRTGTRVYSVRRFPSNFHTTAGPSCRRRKREKIQRDVLAYAYINENTNLLNQVRRLAEGRRGKVHTAYNCTYTFSNYEIVYTRFTLTRNPLNARLFRERAIITICCLPLAPNCSSN